MPSFAPFAPPADVAFSAPASDTPLRPEALARRERAWAQKLANDRAAWSALLNNDPAGPALQAAGWTPFEPGSVSPPLPDSGMSAQRQAVLGALSAWQAPEQLRAACFALDALAFWDSLEAAWPTLALPPQAHALSWPLALAHASPATLSRMASDLETAPPAPIGAWKAFLARDDAQAAVDALAEALPPQALWPVSKAQPGLLIHLSSALRSYGQPERETSELMSLKEREALKQSMAFWPDRFEPLLRRIVEWAEKKPLDEKSARNAVAYVFGASLTQIYQARGIQRPEALAATAVAHRVISFCAERHWDVIASVEKSWRGQTVSALRTGANGKPRDPSASWMALGQRLRSEPSDVATPLSLWEMAIQMDEPRWLDWAQKAAGPWSWGEPFAISIPNPWALLRSRDVARVRAKNTNGGPVMERAFANARQSLEKALIPHFEKKALLELLDQDSTPGGAPPDVDWESKTISRDLFVPTSVESLVWKCVGQDRPRVRAWLAERAKADPQAAAERLREAADLEQTGASALRAPPESVSTVFFALKEHAEILATVAAASAASASPQTPEMADSAANATTASRRL